MEVSIFLVICLTFCTCKQTDLVQMPLTSASELGLHCLRNIPNEGAGLKRLR